LGAAGADEAVAAGVAPRPCVEEVVEAPPGVGAADVGGAELVVVVVGFGHAATICWYCVQVPGTAVVPPALSVSVCPEPGLPTSTKDKTTMSAAPPTTLARSQARARRLPRGCDTLSPPERSVTPIATWENPARPGNLPPKSGCPRRPPIHGSDLRIQCSPQCFG
jgi:hypothetical protein